MKQLEYPFDARLILSKKKKIKRELLGTGNNFTDIRVAVLGGSTTNDIIQILELFLLNHGLKPQFYESEYNQYYQDAVFDNSDLAAFRPDIIYIHTSNRNITKYPEISDSAETVNLLLNNEADKFCKIWTSLTERYHCPIIQNNFELPYYRLMGNREAYDVHGAVNFVGRLNERFYEYARSHDNFYICDINYISADYGLKAWSDPFYWHMYKYALAVPAIPYLSFNVANLIKSLYGKNKEVFVLGLDNTLWGGVIGDDGPENIVIGPEESEGQAYTEFQRYIKAHQSLGILLNIDSKNDYENAIKGIQHPDSAFTEKDFISLKANWDPKDRHFIQIAEELNLLPESLVFIDDNPAERHIVTQQIPGVQAPEISQVTDYIQTIDRSGFFEVTKLSVDDLSRNDMYRKNAERVKLQNSFSDYGEYLKSLEMEADIKSFEPIYYARIAQLSNKSNQFNLTTKRYMQTEIENVALDTDYITLYGKLIDRFGDNGVVSLIIGHQIDDICHIDLCLMSCRVLKRDMEYAMMDALAARCIEREIRTIKGYYYPTAKNHMVELFYKDMGFTLIDHDETGNSVWVMDLTEGYTNQNKYIDVHY